MLSHFKPAYMHALYSMFAMLKDMQKYAEEHTGCIIVSHNAMHLTFYVLQFP